MAEVSNCESLSRLRMTLNLSQGVIYHVVHSRSESSPLHVSPLLAHLADGKTNLTSYPWLPGMLSEWE